MTTTHTNTAAADYELNWKKLDPECRWGFRGVRFTGVNFFASMLLGIVLSAIFYAALFPFHGKNYPMIDMFFHGGPENRSAIPYFTIFLAGWSLAILWIKYRKLRIQRLALKLPLVPSSADFVLTPATAQEILRKINLLVYMPQQFILFNRMERALADLRNIGRISDLSSVLNDLAAADEKYTENSYTLLHGFLWAIPVLGFIGTVIGLSVAVGGFGSVVAGGADLDALKEALSGVTGGLATAFETTLIALVAALCIQLLSTLLMQKEEEFLHDCANYCHRNIVAKLRAVPENTQENSTQHA